jgi:uncharacterized Zn-binding protein involved in type VI secretion
MGQPAAKQGDQIVATDTHIVLVPSPSGSVPTPLPHPFSGILDGNLSSDVKIENRPAATVDSTATNTPPHIPTPPGVSFANPPKNQGKIIMGSVTVTISGKPAARAGDTALTCNDPADMPVGTVVAQSTVLIG